jgi:phosphogluconate dehydratase
VIRELLRGGLMHGDALSIAADGMAAYGRKAVIDGEALAWQDLPEKSADDAIVRTLDAPFSPEGGFRILQGNLGRACIKVSAVERSRWTIEAPCRVFSDQAQVQAAFKAGELDRDVIVVVRFQGPRANGMPELHKLTPPLGVLQNRGFKVALLTDGRMSGASGKVPCAIHLSPEALGGGPIAKLCDGDMVRLCAEEGILEALVDAAEWDSRAHAEAPPCPPGTGRELFAMMRHGACEAEEGASAMLAMAGL